ncbi:MAG: hydrogenase, partial [Burkholderiales bacterium PBB5]
MCIGLPLQVIATRAGFATVAGRGGQREVSTALVGEPALGQWLLVFIDGARELIDPQRAAEVNATLDLVEAAMNGLGSDIGSDTGSGRSPVQPHDDPGFA